MAQDKDIFQNIPSYPLIPFTQETGALELGKRPLRTWPLFPQLVHRSEQQIIPINFFETQKLKLKKSFNVVLEYYPEDNLYIVDSPELNIYGEGQDRTEALNDFSSAIEETYLSLKEDRDRLGPQPEREWKILKELIEER